jgi:hypothetical protein
MMRFVQAYPLALSLMVAPSDGLHAAVRTSNRAVAATSTSLFYASNKTDSLVDFGLDRDQIPASIWGILGRRPEAPPRPQDDSIDLGFAFDMMDDEEQEKAYWDYDEEGENYQDDGYAKESSESYSNPTLQILRSWTEEYIQGVHMAGGMTRVTDVVQDMLASEFVFTSPNVGPLNKPDYIKLMGYYQNYGLDLATGIPDLQVSYEGWHVDPDQPWRIWAVARYSGTHFGTVVVPGTDLQLTPPSNGQPPVRFTSGPEVQSFLWTPDKKILWHTMGYVGDEYTGSNKGYGGIDGLLVSMGLPTLYLDATSPFRRAKKFFSQFQADNGETSARTQTRFGRLPQWWNERKSYGLNVFK